MLFRSLLQTAVTGVFHNTQCYFGAPYVNNGFTQPFKQNIPRLPGTQQDCFRTWRVNSYGDLCECFTKMRLSHLVRWSVLPELFILLKDLKCSHGWRISSLLSSSFNFYLLPIYGLLFIRTEFFRVYKPPPAVSYRRPFCMGGPSSHSGRPVGSEVQHTRPMPIGRFSRGESGLHCTYATMRLAFTKTPSPWIEAANVYHISLK